MGSPSHPETPRQTEPGKDTARDMGFAPSGAPPTEDRRLRGTVERVTFRRLNDGRVRHWTRVVFDPDRDKHPFRSVALSGTLPSGYDPEALLLGALATRYIVVGLPQVRWSGEPEGIPF